MRDSSLKALDLLLAEGDGRLDEVTINGDAARVNVLKEGLAGPTAVTLVGDIAFVLEAKLNDRNDQALRGQDPGPFRVVAIPYRAPKQPTRWRTEEAVPLCFATAHQSV